MFLKLHAHFSVFYIHVFSDILDSVGVSELLPRENSETLVPNAQCPMWWVAQCGGLIHLANRLLRPLECFTTSLLDE